MRTKEGSLFLVVQGIKGPTLPLKYQISVWWREYITGLPSVFGRLNSTGKETRKNSDKLLVGEAEGEKIAIACLQSKKT